MFNTYPKNIDVDDPVLYFHNGDNWIVIPLVYIYENNIMHDNIYDIVTEQKYNVSIVSCPVTGIITIINGQFNVKEINDDGLVLYNKNNIYSITELHNFKRWTCFINNLKNALIKCPDAKYFITDKYSGKKIENILKNKICFLVEYSNNNKTKYTVLETKKNINMKESKFDNYYNKYKKSIDIKLAVINPIYCSAIDRLNIKYKIINL